MPMLGMVLGMAMGVAAAGDGLQQGRRLEAAWAEAVVRGDGDAEQREVQAGHAYQHACTAGDAAACDRLDALISARRVDPDACMYGWAPACERLPLARRADLCVALGPAHPACDVGARIIGRPPRGLRGLVPFGAQVDGHLWTDTGSERWVADPTDTAVIGPRLYWVKAGTDASQFFRLTESGLEDLGVVAELGLRDVVEDDRGRAWSRRQVWEQHRGEERFGGFELVPLEGGRVQRHPAGAAWAGDTRVWYPDEGVVAWGSWAGAERGRTETRRSQLSPDGRALAVEGADGWRILDTHSSAASAPLAARSVSWSSDSVWLVARTPDETRLHRRDGSLAHTLPAADAVLAGSGLVALDGTILELEPGAWRGAQPPRSAPAETPQALQGDPPAHASVKGRATTLRVLDCAGAPAAGLDVHMQGWMGTLDRRGTVRIPAEVAGAGRFFERRSGLRVVRDSERVRVTADNADWGGMLELRERCPVTVADAALADPRTRRALALAMGSHAGWTARRFVPPGDLSLRPDRTAHRDRYGPLLVPHDGAWWRSTLALVDGDWTVEHVRASTRRVAIVDQAGEPVPHAMLVLSIPRGGGPNPGPIRADAEGRLDLPEGTRIEGGDGRVVDDDRVVLALGAVGGRVAAFDPSLRYRRVDAPTEVLSGAELARQAPVVVADGRVVSRSGSKTLQWEPVP